MPKITQLLDRWRAGDAGALAEILVDHLPWILGEVRRRLRPSLRAKIESGDLVQDAIVEFLTYGPPVIPASGKQLRRLLARIVEHRVSDTGSWFSAVRRSMAHEQPLDASTGVDLRAPPSAEPPARAARAEMEARLRLAIEVLPEKDRFVLALRSWEKLPWKDVAARLGVSEDGARKRHDRATARLRHGMARLRHGELDRLLDEMDTAEREEKPPDGEPGAG